MNTTAAEHTLVTSIPGSVTILNQAFNNAGESLFIVGGAVRDALLGVTSSDFDLATSAHPSKTIEIVEKAGFSTLTVGASFGVVIAQVSDQPEGIEIATFREDVGAGRRPDSVEFSNIEADVLRRDFTVNALFFDLNSNKIVDLVGGIDDLKNKVIRTVGNPNIRFSEDPLRKLRALRFVNRIDGCTLDERTGESLKKNPSLEGVSTERIREELLKSIDSAVNVNRLLNMLHAFDMFKEIFPGHFVQWHVNRVFDEDTKFAVIPWLLKGNAWTGGDEELHKLKFTREEITNITFLHRLLVFQPRDIVIIKKLEERITLADEQVRLWGDLIGATLPATIKSIQTFELTVRGEDGMKLGLIGPDLGKWILDTEVSLFIKHAQRTPQETNN